MGEKKGFFSKLKAGLSKKIIYDFLKHFTKLFPISDLTGRNHCRASIVITINQKISAASRR